MAENLSHSDELAGYIHNVSPMKYISVKQSLEQEKM